MDILNKNLSIKTKTVISGGEADKETGAIMPPIYQTSTYVQKSPGKHKGYEYSRSHNPTRTRLEKCLASLENGKYALVTASGMSACSLLMHNLKKDSSILFGDDVYGGTYRLFKTVFNNIHKFYSIDMTNIKIVERAVQKYKPNMLWLESPTNPLLKIADIKKITQICKKNKIITVIDNTFMSPYFQNPLKLSADIVLHSLTKFINGHSDIIGGAIILNDYKMYQELWALQNSIGPSMSPFDSWLTLRGIRTLSIRMQAHQSNATEIAKFLEKHPKVEKVIYPGLKSHPQHNLAKKQMNGFGGMISFIIKGNLTNVKKFISKLKLFSLAESLGGVESLIESPALMTHAALPKKVREKIGIYDNLLRISVGIEDYNDLINDIKNALK